MSRVAVLMLMVLPFMLNAQETHLTLQDPKMEATEELTVNVDVQDFYSVTGLMVSAKTLQGMDDKKEVLTEVKYALSAQKFFNTPIKKGDKVTITKNSGEYYSFLHQSSGIKKIVRLKGQ